MTSAKERCEDAAVVAVLSELPVDNVFKLPLQAGLARIVLAILTHMVLCFFGGHFGVFIFRL